MPDLPLAEVLSELPSSLADGVSCPNCGRGIDAFDLDFCYPLERTRARWRAGCNRHDFGCGFELEGTLAEVLAPWGPKKSPGRRRGKKKEDA